MSRRNRTDFLKKVRVCGAPLRTVTQEQIVVRSEAQFQRLTKVQRMGSYTRIEVNIYQEKLLIGNF